MTRFESVVDAVGNTPLIRLTRSVAGLAPKIYVKVEANNPGGSVKDRAALSMIRQAEADGSLAPGGTIVETTSGNTGIGLALFAAHLGYRSVIFTSSGTSREKRSLLTAYGAELRLVDTFVPKEHPDSLRSTAERFVAETPGAWLAGQYDNPANPAAHWRSTGPEIWADTEGAVTHLVATVGTGGTISGTGGYLKEVSAGSVTVVGADPLTSSYSGGDGSLKYIEGAGHFVHPDATDDVWPEALDVGVIDRYFAVDDRTAIQTVRDLARTEGILAGGSAGVALAAAFELAAELTTDDTIVVILPDSGRAYLSTYFDDDWLHATGFRLEADAAAFDDLVAGAQDRALVTLDRGTEVRLALEVLDSAGVDKGAAVLVTFARERQEALHPAEVQGWVTRDDLAAASAGTLLTELARSPLPRVGLGLSLEAARERLGADWSVALVLEDGRVRSTLRRESLELRLASPSSGQPISAQSRNRAMK